MTKEQAIIQGLQGHIEALNETIEKQDKIIKALEQQTINSNTTTEEIAQSFKADVEAVKDYLPKCNSMEFPKTFDEFANDYGFTDDKEIYTNGSHLIPVFRVKQWLEHIEQQSEDCVSRAQAIEWIENLRQMDKCFGNYEDDYFPLSEVIDRLKNVPPVTPTHGTCKECNLWCKDRAIDGACFCSSFHTYTGYDFYCAGFEKR